MTATRTSPARWAATVLGGAALAAATGALAAWAQTGGWDLLRFAVYAVVSAPCWIGLVLVALSTEQGPEHVADSVETQWLQTAATGAFVDLLTVLGLATAATAVLDVEPVPTVLFVVLGMVDVGLRLELQRRREG